MKANEGARDAARTRLLGSVGAALNGLWELERDRDRFEGLADFDAVQLGYLHAIRAAVIELERTLGRRALSVEEFARACLRD